jgi:uncharacterized membrane protein
MTSMTSATTTPPTTGGMRKIAAISALLVSIAGVGVGLHLTRIKFQMLYTPCVLGKGGCNVGGLTCEDSLASTWSTLAGLPISLWASAFYVATAVLAGGVLRRGEFLRGAAAPLLFGLSLFGSGVSLLFAIYAFGILGSPCPFCMTLYVISALLVGAAFMLRRSQPEDPTWVRRRQIALLDAGFMIAMTFVLVAGVQSVFYQLSRRFVDAQQGCPEPVKTLPAATIKSGAADPKVILAMFIDLSCVHCKAEFRSVAGALANGEFPEPTALWIFHTPRQACDPEAFPAGYAKSDDNVRFDNPCMAARAAECMEKLQPGAGYDLIGGMYALHDDRKPNTPLFTAERIGNVAVDLEMQIDPDDEDNALFKCINEDKELLARISEHQRYAEGPKFQIPTLAVYAAVGGQPDMTRKPLYAWANTPVSTLAEYITMQAKPPVAR